MKNNEFIKFQIDKRLIEKLNQKYIFVPTKIQEEVIPKILSDKDVIAQSKTGTGKTISYIIPILHKLIQKKSQTLIVSPTKELARQIYDELVYYSENLDINIILLAGGDEIEKQEDKIKKGFDIAVGVTGRILKLSESGGLKLTSIKKIILEEADFLIDLGFLNEIEKIYSLAKNCEQTLVFSATLSSKTKKVLNILKNQDKTARIDAKNTLPLNIKNYFFPIEDGNREDFLIKIMKNINPYLSLIFVRTKKESIWLYNIIKENGFLVDCLNGDLTPSKRKKALENFKNAKNQYLIATDLASRGLDIDGINYIINYNLPLNELDYLHRAGRTGRMNVEGIVYTLCNQLDEGYLKKYAVNLGMELEALKLTKTGIEKYKNYIGVKPRFNIEEIKKQGKIKQSKKKEKEKDVPKKRRNTPKR